MNFTTKVLTTALVALMCLTAQTVKSQTASIQTGYNITAGADVPDTQPTTAVTTASGDYLPEMVFVKGGKFMMGSNEGDNDEMPVHDVKVIDFYMGKTEVTVAQFKAFIDDTGYETSAELNYRGSYVLTGHDKGTWKDSINWRHDEYGNLRPESEYDRPVIHVNRSDAYEYCLWLKHKTRKTYHLPTEAEWEYAAQDGALADANSTFPAFKFAGSQNISEVAWYEANSSYKLQPVGQKLPNRLGLYDMTGNVWEWCSDFYEKRAYKHYNMDNLFPITKMDKDCNTVVRGGGFFDEPDNCRVANRQKFSGLSQMFMVGFRVTTYSK